MLGRFAEYPAIFEPFRNPASDDEICDCLSKILDTKAKLRRKAKKSKTSVKELEVPKLWILTPTASPERLDGFNVKPAGSDWLQGIYFLGETLRSAIVVIHQLPAIPDTLWLRILGREGTQKQAIDELLALPENHKFRKATLELLYNFRQKLSAPFTIKHQSFTNCWLLSLKSAESLSKYFKYSH